ncbi:MAG: peptide chain release factor 3 [Planctomycetia bacterium]|nr:MAG: peptide chain release factor 3 [Planctomycetia bacterium]
MRDEIARRRTFAIISHPDAGKTTLTEKFLLYGGAVQLAGSVTARKNQRASTSDWMELERKRGISVSSTVLQFDYRGYCVNLLDTPGHKDFSEDTYRVLTAVDSVVMVIDAGKGIEPQTRKLFEICRQRGVPIFTFMNKLDRPARDPLDLLHELEQVLGLHACAMNWPLGNGMNFRGVFDRRRRALHVFEATTGGVYRAPVSVTSLSDPLVRDDVGSEAIESAEEELALLDGAAAAFDPEAVLRGELTPVFFGSASNNFGVQMLLDAFLESSPAPRMRHARGGPIQPDHQAFSGFVFKMQANMDPKHRDCIAFVRVCSGRFERSMTVLHQQSGGKVRLSSSHKLFARERETVDVAYAGDVIGIVGHPEFRVGDTLTEDPGIWFQEIPRFAPECFAFLHATGASQHKRFRSGLEQLLQEGVVQRIQLEGATQNAPLLGVVGPLQFDVVQYRLETEYGAQSRLEAAPWERLRWIDPRTPESALALATLPSRAALARDSAGDRVILFGSEWELRYFMSKHPEVLLGETHFDPDGCSGIAKPTGVEKNPATPG